MSAAVLTQSAPAASRRLLADVDALGHNGEQVKPPALERLEAALGRELADSLVAALSEQEDPRRSG